MNRKRLSLVLLAITLLFVTGCIGRMRVGADLEESETVELGTAERARVNIKMGVGEVRIDGGANDLLEADFSYNVEDWKPEVTYDVSGDEGRLTVSQPDDDIKGIPDDDIKYKWDLNLNDDVPMDMDVNLGVGDSYLELSGLTLTDLDVQIGVGRVTIDLSGDWDESFNAHIRGGIGDTNIILPRKVGVRVETQTGIGSINVRGLIRDGNTYTNEAYDSADVIIDIEVQGGVGTIDLQLGD